MIKMGMYRYVLMTVMTTIQISLLPLEVCDESITIAMISLMKIPTAMMTMGRLH